MSKSHHYHTRITWTGNLGEGTRAYTSYKRDHILSAEGKPEIAASSDPAFRGDPKRYNPEEMFLASVSSCHMLWYLHLCASNGVVVVDYEDEASATLAEKADGSGQFSEIVLHPQVWVAEVSMTEKARHLHEEANRMCFIAGSLNLPVHHQPNIMIKDNPVFSPLKW